MSPTQCLTLAALTVGTCLRAEPDPLDAVEKSTAQWIELRAETVRLATGWQTEQRLLESTVRALEDRAKAAEEERDLAKAKSAKDLEDMESLDARVKASALDQQHFETRLAAINQRLLALRDQLPPRLADALSVSFTSLSGSELSPGERIQLTVSVLNRCAQFNRMITGGDEVLRVDGSGDGRMFEVIYWGLSHGYAVDRAARRAWYGSPGPQGWHWESRDDLAEPALELIAIFNDHSDPAFVAAPARINHAVPGQSQP